MYRYIVGSYAVASSFVIGANYPDKIENHNMLTTFVDLHRFNNPNYGNNMAVATIVFAPFLVPVYSISLPMIVGYEKLSKD